MLHTIQNLSSWAEPIDPETKAESLMALENGKVIYLPQLTFEFNDVEKALLTPSVLAQGSKNICFDPQHKALKRSTTVAKSAIELAILMTRFYENSHSILTRLFPHYQEALITGRTSYRPIEIEGRKTSILKDDTRLHVDAFPATPNAGKRILRVFSNVNPHKQSRLWHLGESFKEVVDEFLPSLRKPCWGSRRLLSTFKLTKSYRTLYDHYMLSLHNQMKLSDTYQKKVNKLEMPFPAGSTWIVMTDEVSHAALSGQFMLEQTFYLPVNAMQNPERSPLRVLEKALVLSLV